MHTVSTVNADAGKVGFCPFSVLGVMLHTGLFTV